MEVSKGNAKLCWIPVVVHCKCYLFLFVQLLLINLVIVSGQQGDGVAITPADYLTLKAIQQELVDFNGYLQRSWNDSGSGACSGKWAGIKCIQGNVIAIQLPWKGLGGQISEKIGQLQALRKLSLHDNLLSGPIPATLGSLPNIRGIYLFNNRLSGTISPSLGHSPYLQALDISNNALSGTITPSLASSTRIYRLNLSYNSFSGSVPVSFTHSPSLVFLALEHNNLSGSIPDTWGGAGNKVYQLQALTLDHNTLSGPVPVSLSKLDGLEVISLSHNRLNGAIPNEIGILSHLQILDLSYNAINGSLPSSFANLTSLASLDLVENQLSNEIPDSIVRLQNLSVMNLKGNHFTGKIPSSLGNISSISQLDLSYNNFSGEIPDSLANLSNLTSFNVSYNNLSGSVPSSLSTRFNSSSFAGNNQLCGYSNSTPCLSHTPQVLPPSPQETPKQHEHHRRLSTKDIILIAVGVLLAVLLVLCCILLCCLIRKREASKQNGKAAATGRSIKTVPPVVTTEVESSGGRLVHFEGPFVFTADDLLCATAEIMGKSTYGTAYKATLEDGSQVLVKRLREKAAKGQKEFEAEVAPLGKIRHPNLLALRAYYLGPKGEKLLVFDCMNMGSLASFLHARGPETVIDWPTRKNIAIGIAQGLCHLHTQEDIIHGNLTSSSILLDDQTNPHIAEVGLNRLMTAASNTNVIATAGALGYRAPELAKLKKPTISTDIYSFGVIILELLTGKSPGDPISGMDLPQWVASIVKEEWTNEVFDLELMKDQSVIGDDLLNTLKLALHCVDPSSAARPNIGEVLQHLQDMKLDPTVGSDESNTQPPLTSE